MPYKIIKTPCKIFCVINLISFIFGQHHWETAIFASDDWNYIIPDSEPSDELENNRF